MAGLVEFQKRIFANIEELHRAGDEKQFLRFVSAGYEFVVPSEDVHGVATLGSVVEIPGAPNVVVGLIQSGGSPWTLCDFAMIQKRPATSRLVSKIIIVNPTKASGVALLVDRAFTLLPQGVFQTSGDDRAELAAPWISRCWIDPENEKTAHEVDMDVLLNDTVFGFSVSNRTS